MDIKELRIGNAVMCQCRGEHKTHTIKSIWYNDEEKLYFVELDNGFQCNINGITPIPITKELLEKNGFKKPKEDVFVVKDFCTLLRVTFYPKETAFELDKHSFFPSDIIETIQSNVIVLNNPIYVHTLQNIWYLLTGKELEIKL